MVSRTCHCGGVDDNADSCDAGVVAMLVLMVGVLMGSNDDQNIDEKRRVPNVNI